MSTRKKAKLGGWVVVLCVLSTLLLLSQLSSVWAAPHQHGLRQTVPPSPPTATPPVPPTPTPTPPPEVPEPSTLLLLASGLVALGGYASWKRANKRHLH